VSSGPNRVGAEAVWTYGAASRRQLTLRCHSFVFMISEQLSKYELHSTRVAPESSGLVSYFMFGRCLVHIQAWSSIILTGVP